MVEEATTIDLVVADKLTSDFEVGTRAWRRMRSEPEGSVERTSADEWLKFTQESWAGDGARVHFRVVTRLKGNSSGLFTLNAQRPAPAVKSPGKAHAVALSRLSYILDVADLLDGPGMGDCSIAFEAEVGRKYLIFRDADGLPLRVEVPVRFAGAVLQRGGPSVVPVVSLNDPWPKLVLKTLSEQP